MADISGTIGAIVTGVIGVAIVSVLVSKNAQTGTVISQAFGGLSSVISAATGPITGAKSASSGIGGSVSSIGGFNPLAAFGSAGSSSGLAMGGFDPSSLISGFTGGSSSGGGMDPLSALGGLLGGSGSGGAGGILGSFLGGGLF